MNGWALLLPLGYILGVLLQHCISMCIYVVELFQILILPWVWSCPFKSALSLQVVQSGPESQGHSHLQLSFFFFFLKECENSRERLYAKHVLLPWNGSSFLERRYKREQWYITIMISRKQCLACKTFLGSLVKEPAFQYFITDSSSQMPRKWPWLIYL